VAREDSFTVAGVVTECLPNAMFRITLDSGQVLMGHLAGRLRVNRITIIIGDKVDVEVSVYDTTKGRIVYRHKG